MDKKTCDIVKDLLPSYIDGICLDGSRELINRAYAVFVALDENDQPSAVPPFTPETEEEIREYKDAEVRRKQRTGR